MPHLGGASAAHHAVAPARAPLRWPFTSRRAQELAQQASAADEESSDESSSSEAGESSRVQSPHRRGRVGTSTLDSASMSQDSADAGGECSEQGTVQPAEPADAAVPDISKGQVAERSSAMFVIGTSGPKEVRTPLLAPTVTKGLVKLALEVANELCDRVGTRLHIIPTAGAAPPPM